MSRPLLLLQTCCCCHSHYLWCHLEETVVTGPA